MKKILVVDDEIHIVQVVAIKLRNNGFEVITADNGQSAYNLAVAECPDAIITDLQMPGITGLEMVEKLRNTESVADIPVIMLTARGLSIDTKEIERLSIVACLSKPFSPREVLATLKAAVEPITV